MNIRTNDIQAQKAETAAPKARTSFQLIVFRLGGEEYALVIDQIKEVVITPKVSRIPLTPTYIKGVANIRGNILAILDLEERFGLATGNGTDGNAAHNYTLVVASEEFRMGILVKEVPNTLTVQAGDIDLSPGLISDGSAENGCIRGIVRSGSRIIILIDVFKVISKEHITQSLTATVA
jgi:purine-binding chemotaxis protein CheW